jgi:hypothetical protein
MINQKKGLRNQGCTQSEGINRRGQTTQSPKEQTMHYTKSQMLTKHIPTDIFSIRYYHFQCIYV